jgi:hypothetical protein
VPAYRAAVNANADFPAPVGASRIEKRLFESNILAMTSSAALWIGRGCS